MTRPLASAEPYDRGIKAARPDSAVTIAARRSGIRAAAENDLGPVRPMRVHESTELQSRPSRARLIRPRALVTGQQVDANGMLVPGASKSSASREFGDQRHTMHPMRPEFLLYRRKSCRRLTRRRRPAFRSSWDLQRCRRGLEQFRGSNRGNALPPTSAFRDSTKTAPRPG